MSKYIEPPTVPFGGSQFDHKVAKDRKVRAALRDYFKEEQIDWVTPSSNHPLSGKTEKKESR